MVKNSAFEKIAMFAWSVLLLIVLLGAIMVFGPFVDINVSGTKLILISMSVGSGSVFLLCVYKLNWFANRSKTVLTLASFLLVPVVDLSVTISSIYIIGFFVFPLIYLHWVLFVIGLVYFGLKLFKSSVKPPEAR